MSETAFRPAKRTCRLCNKTKLAKEFRRLKGEYTDNCHECMRERWRENHPKEKRRQKRRNFFKGERWAAAPKYADGTTKPYWKWTDDEQAAYNAAMEE